MNASALRSTRRCSALFSLALMAACGDDDSSQPARDAGRDPAPGSQVHALGRAVLAPRARVLDDDALLSLRSMRAAGTRIELAFLKRAEQLDEIEPGDVLIAGASEHTPQGGLFTVQEITEDGGELLMFTERAELGDAFETLEVELEATLAQAADATILQDGGVAASQQPLGLTFPFVFRAEGGGGQGELSGSLSIDSSIALELDFDFTEFELEELSMSLGAEETFVAELVNAGESGFEETVDLGSIAFTPITLLLPIPVSPGTVPVVLTPQIELTAGVRGTVAGEVQASVLQEASFSAGLGFHDGEFQGFSETDSRFDFEQPTYEAGVNLRAWAGPRMEVLLYGAVGPFAGVDAFVELAASVEGPPPCVRGVLDAGLTGKAGVELLAHYETVLFDERSPLAHYDSCDDDPDAPRPAVTWARTYAREGSSGEIARAVAEAEDGSLLVVGDSDLFADVTGFAASAWALRLDALGNVVWQRAFQRSGLGLVRGAAGVPSGFLVAGTSGVMKLDSGGNPVWARQYTGEPLVEITSIAAHADGRFAVSGFHDTDSTGWAMGLDERGEVLWSQRFAGKSISRVRATADGGYVLIGQLPEEFDITLIKLDAGGDVVWGRLIDNLFDASPEVPDDPIATSDDYAFDVAEKPEGGYVIAGEAYGPFPLPQPQPAGFYGTWIAEVDEQGALIEGGSVTHRAPTDAVYGGAYAVAVRDNGSALIAGRRADTAQDLLQSEDVLLIQGGSYTVIGGAGNDRIDTGLGSGGGRGNPLVLTRDGGAVLAVTTDSFAGRDEFWVIKLNRSGFIDLPQRTSVEGRSFVNADAQSPAFDAAPEPVEVTGESFAAELAVEITDVTSAQQNP